MARYNLEGRKATRATMVPDHEGGLSFKQSPEMALYSLACTSILKPKFYESSAEEIGRLRALVGQVDPEWVAKLAVYVRSEMHLRSMPVVLAVELVQTRRASAELVRRMICGVIQRPDEILEVLAYYAKVRGMNPRDFRAIYRGVKLGIADAFAKFDAYALGKWRGPGKGITLQDAIRLTHPKPIDEEHSALYEAVADDTLPTPPTWETDLSELGQQLSERKASDLDRAAAVKGLWGELVTRRGPGSLGYMALLRNLRNMLDADIGRTELADACAALSDPCRVRKSRQLPFRFYTAYKMLQSHPHPMAAGVLEALNKAMLCSAENIQFIDSRDTVAIAIDVSGSMSMDLNESTCLWEIGALLALTLASRCPAVTLLLFDTDLKVLQMPKTAEILGAMNDVRQYVHGGGTNGHLVFRFLNEHAEYNYNKLFMFSDMQVWRTDRRLSHFSQSEHDTEIPKLWGQYVTKHPGARAVMVDLAGYGTVPVDTQHDGTAYLVAGWSDRIFEMIAAIERGSSVKAEIAAVELG